MKSFTFYEEYYRVISFLNKDDQNVLILAILQYMFDDVEPSLEETQMRIFEYLKIILDNTKKLTPYWEDDNLSLKAKGLLTYMVNVPNAMECSISELAYKNDCGNTSIKTTLQELEKNGYLTREQGRNKGGKFTFSKYAISDVKNTTSTVDGKTVGGEIENTEKKEEKERTKEKEEIKEIPPYSPPLTDVTIDPPEVGNNITPNNPLTDRGRKIDENITKSTLDDSSGCRRNGGVKITDSMVRDVAENVIGYMNHLDGGERKATTKDTLKHIKARLQDGFTDTDLAKVVHYTYNEWVANESVWSNGKKSSEYFRPNTIFSAKNFENYLERYRKKYERREK